MKQNQDGNKTCPIRGCNYEFTSASHVGWYKHVGSLTKHPDYHPQLTDMASRVEAFKKDYPGFVKDSSTTLKAVLPNVDPRVDKIVEDFLALAKRVSVLSADIRKQDTIPAPASVEYDPVRKSG